MGVSFVFGVVVVWIGLEVPVWGVTVTGSVFGVRKFEVGVLWYVVGFVVWGGEFWLGCEVDLLLRYGFWTTDGGRVLGVFCGRVFGLVECEVLEVV